MPSSVLPYRTPHFLPSHTTPFNPGLRQLFHFPLPLPSFILPPFPTLTTHPSRSHRFLTLLDNTSSSHTHFQSSPEFPILSLPLLIINYLSLSSSLKVSMATEKEACQFTGEQVVHIQTAYIKTEKTFDFLAIASKLDRRHTCCSYDYENRFT